MVLAADGVMRTRHWTDYEIGDITDTAYRRDTTLQRTK